METDSVVYVVDDDQAIREAIRFLMASENVACKTFASAEQFLDYYRPELCGCLLVDIRMPGINGLEFQQIINNKKIPMPVIFITGHGDIPLAVQAMKAGAMEFFEKPFDNNELLETVKAALNTSVDQFYDSSKNKRLIELVGSLSRREQQIFYLLAQGKMNKVIAGELDISTRTVEVHRAHIMEKLKIRSFSDIVRIAMKCPQQAQQPEYNVQNTHISSSMRKNDINR